MQVTALRGDRSTLNARHRIARRVTAARVEDSRLVRLSADGGVLRRASAEDSRDERGCAEQAGADVKGCNRPGDIVVAPMEFRSYV